MRLGQVTRIEGAIPPLATANRLEPPAMMEPFTAPAVDSATPSASTRGSTALRHPDLNAGDAADTVYTFTHVHTYIPLGILRAQQS